MTKLEEAKSYLKKWAADNKCIFEDEGEIGFGRECVGIVAKEHFVDYSGLIDDETWGFPFTVPVDAYHKGDYLAVLGRGENAILQLYEWVKEIESKGYTVKQSPRQPKPNEHPLQTLMSGLTKVELVKL